MFNKLISFRMNIKVEEILKLNENRLKKKKYTK